MTKDIKRSKFGTEKDVEALEERLLQLSEAYLSYKKRCYQDDPVEVLKNLYCLKQPSDKPLKGKTKTSEDSFFSTIMSRVPGLRGEGELYLGIDGKAYRESELQLWSQAHQLLLVLRKKIKEGSFDPEW